MGICSRKMEAKGGGARGDQKMEAPEEAPLRAPIRVLEADENWSLGEEEILQNIGYSTIFDQLGLDGEDELAVEPVVFVALKKDGLLHYPGSAYGGPMIVDAEWTPERMGDKYIPRVCIWDEVCTVPRPILEIFLDWLEHRGVQVVCCGDQGQPPPIAGPMPHDWLREHVDYYEEIADDYRSKCPKLRALKKAIRLQPDKYQCQEMRKALPTCWGWNDFVFTWHPRDLILVSRKVPRDRAQQLLFERHQEAFQKEPVPLLYRPLDTRRQNIKVTVPGPLTDDNPQQELVLNDVVCVSVKTALEVLDGKRGHDWALCYAMTVHSLPRRLPRPISPPARQMLPTARQTAPARKRELGPEKHRPQAPFVYAGRSNEGPRPLQPSPERRSAAQGGPK